VPTYDLRVRGMDCPSCAQDIDCALRKLNGVQKVDVNLIAGKVHVTYREDTVDREEIASTIQRIGYRVVAEANKVTSFALKEWIVPTRFAKSKTPWGGSRRFETSFRSLDGA
jgi:copper chaperone CopZ